MKKYFAFLIVVCVCVTSYVAMAANFQVKKASPVAPKAETSGLEDITSNSLLPGVLDLVSNVAALNKQQQELKAECAPTDAEIEWVNTMVQEYAKIGAVTDTDMLNSIKDRDDNICSGSQTYSSTALLNMPEVSPCIELFADPKADNNGKTKAMVWAKFPKASKGKYCSDGTTDCQETKKKHVSNVYQVFGAINFSEEDYTESEASKYVKFMEKAEKCSDAKIAAQRKAAYTDFIKNTVTGASGQKDSTVTVWDAINKLTQGTGLSGVSNLAPSVLQLMGE